MENPIRDLVDSPPPCDREDRQDCMGLTGLHQACRLAHLADTTVLPGMVDGDLASIGRLVYKWGHC